MDAVDYTVDLSERHAHLYAVEARFFVTGDALELQLPAWTPGSYCIRDYARQVQDLECEDESGGSLPVRKIDKATWRVETGGVSQLRVRYRVFAHELTVRTAHLDDTHGFWNGACLFLYAEPLRGRPQRVAVRAPADWRITTALSKQGETFVARDYDELVDSPFECGTHELVEWSAQERPHRLAIWGRVETPREQLRSDITRIIDAAAALFGGVPYPDYTFILHTSPNGYGGLEHARSATLLTSPFSFRPRKKYEDFLELVSHEFFHLWNVKRIHPDVLGPFDYRREAYTRSLWVMEGVTSYYDRYLLVRAGLKPQARYLEKLGEELAKIAAIPGRQRQSLEESSFDAWIKLYRPDENTVNSTISYYLKGSVVALLCDLEIRSRTRGARSLDDVMRLLWTRHGARGVGFLDRDVQGLFEEGAGCELGGFFDRYVRGRDELDVAPLLRTVGLRLKSSRAEVGEEGAGATLGIRTREDHGAVWIAEAFADGPAAASGLYAGDQLLAVDGFRVDAAGLKERLSVRRPGDRASLTVFRRDELRTIEVLLGQPPHDRYEIVPVDDPTDAERAAYAAWLGGDLSAPLA